MTRKRFIKLAMSYGMSKRKSNAAAKKMVKAYGSYSQAYVSLKMAFTCTHACNEMGAAIRCAANEISRFANRLTWMLRNVTMGVDWANGKDYTAYACPLKDKKRRETRGHAANYRKV